MKKFTPNLFKDFSGSEKTGGIVLIICTALSLILANSPVSKPYLDFWHIHIAGHGISHWINDGLMAIFFLLVGLELELEIYAGELSKMRKAALPLVAALGGMLVPAGIFLALNFNTDSIRGTGIPMATDIAFAMGILSLVGKRVPAPLKVLLTALAVIDDLGAILVIAIFYTKALAWFNLLTALGIWMLLIALNRFRVYQLWPYLIGGIIMWYFMLHSGVHATITGVLLAFAIPFNSSNEKSPSYKLQHALHKPVAFLILPVFALANTGIEIQGSWYKELTSENSLGIIAGLVVGKPLGIFLFTYVAVSLGLCVLPRGIKWKHIVGIGLLGGIGFTMSIFITLLAFSNPEIITQSKIAVFIASILSGLIGYVWLKIALKPQKLLPTD